MDDDERERSAQVRSALLKALGASVVIGVVIALGTTMLVRALGLDERTASGSGDPVGSDAATSPSALPTTALAPAGGRRGEPDRGAERDRPPTSRAVVAATSSLDVSPVIARPMERINLTGTYKGADAVQLQVQRFDDGWTDFDAKTTVRVGVRHLHHDRARGENRFRVYDPQAEKGSNVILVTIQ